MFCRLIKKNLDPLWTILKNSNGPDHAVQLSEKVNVISQIFVLHWQIHQDYMFCETDFSLPHSLEIQADILAYSTVLLSDSLYLCMICFSYTVRYGLSVKKRNATIVKFSSVCMYAGDSSSGFTTLAPTSTSLRMEAADIVVVVIYFIFVIAVGIWVGPGRSSFYTYTSTIIFK